MVLVSIVMLNYNREKYISEAIENVLNQSFRDFELIIVDDCSTDNSAKIIAEYQAKDQRIVTIFHGENFGIAKTFNDGVSRAKGKFLALMDSDDVWISSKLEKQLSILKQNEDLIVWSEGEIIDREGKPTGVTYTQRLNACMHACINKKSGDMFEELLYHDIIFLSSIMFSAEYVRNFRFTEHLKYENDVRLMTTLAKKHKYYFIEEPLAKYRLHEDNIHLTDELGHKKDEIVIGRYLIKEDSKQMSKRTKASILFRIGITCFELDEKVTARHFVLKAINANPLDRCNLNHLGVYLLILAAENNSIAVFFRQTYRAINPLFARIRKRLA
jgi:teichuronic acid biosynthesis glycosyltransferase TuaG